MNWVKLMEYIAAAIIGAGGAITVGLIALITSNIRGYKNVSGKIGTLHDSTLSKQHDEIKNYIDNKIGKLDNQSLAGLLMQKIGKLDDRSLAGLIGKLDNTTLSGQNIDILQAVQNLKDAMNSAKEKDELKRAQLTGDQARLAQSIEALSSFAQVMTDLQVRNNALVKENQQLKQKIAQLQEPTEDLQPEPEEDLSQDGPQQTM